MGIWRDAVRRARRRRLEFVFGTVALGLGLAAVFVAYAMRSGVAALVPWRGGSATFRVERASRGPFNGVTYRQYLATAEELRGRLELAVFIYKPGLISGGSQPESIDAGYVSSSLFRMLEVHPRLGSIVAEPSDRWALITSSLWRSEFGSDPKAVGRPFWFNHEQYHVTGVLSDGDAYPRGVDLFLPVASSQALVNVPVPVLTLFARPNKGVGKEAVAGLIGSALARLDHGSRIVEVRSVADLVAGQAEQQLRLLMMLAGLLLAAAWFNVLLVFLLEAHERSGEIAIKRMLGIGRGRLVREFLVEGSLFSGLAVLFGWFLSEALVRTGAVGLPMGAVGLAGWTGAVAAAAICTVLLAATCAMACTGGGDGSWQAAQVSSGGKIARAGTSGTWKWVIAVEAGVAVVLLAGAGTFLLSLGRLVAIAPGFSPDGLWAISVDDTAAPRPMQADILNALGRLPGAGPTAAASYGPLTKQDFMYRYSVVDTQGRSRGIGEIETNFVNPGYFVALRVSLVTGRSFAASDRADSAPGCLVNHAFAAQFLGHDPLSERLTIGDSGECKLIGVVGDFRADSITEPAKPMVFLPLSPARGRFTALLRTITGSGIGPEDILKAVASVDPNLPRPDVVRVDDLASGLIATEGRWALVAATLASYCLLIAAVGLVALVTSSGRRSRQEIAVRLALGGSLQQVSYRMARNFLGPLLIGACIGLLAAIQSARLLVPQLFGVERTGQVLAIAAAVCVIGVGALLVWMASVRVCSVPPAAALRG